MVSMNRVFLLFPIVKDGEECFHPYLQAYNYKNSEELSSFMEQLFRALSIIDHEKYSGYFDNKVLVPFYRSIEKGMGKEAAILLMEYLNDWADYQQMENYVPTDINVNGVDLKGGDILDAFMQCGREKGVIVDLDALCVHPKSLKTSRENGGISEKSFLPCDEKALYDWFVVNREPQRVLDLNYRKHGLFAKEGHRGVISPLTYNYAEASVFLQKAVCGKGEDKRLVFWLKKEHKILIFFNENLSSNPTYHAYEIADDQQKELAKLSTGTKKKMERISTW